MPSSDVWLPLTIALLGIVGTLASAQLTQKRADRREDARAELETSRESVRHAREDSARLFDHRRDAYLDFLSSISSELNGWIEYQQTNVSGPPEPPEDHLEGLWGKLTIVQIYGTPQAAQTAEAMYRWLSTDMFGSRDVKSTNDHEGRYDELQAEFVRQVRRDLGVDPSTTFEPRVGRS